jgi:O-antigen/teichoic acid export membrane protein
LLKDIKNTIKESVVYGLSKISSKLVAFLLLPVITSYLSVNDYGIYVRVESLWQIFWAILLFGLESGVIRWFTLINDEIQRKKFLFSVTIFLLIFNLIFFLLVSILSPQLSFLIFESGNYTKLILFASAIAACEAFSFLFFLILRIERKAFSYSLLSILNSVILLALQYYFLLTFVNKLEGIFLAKILAPLSIVIILIPYFYKYIKIGWESKLLKELIVYSVPVVLGSLAITLLNQADKFILGRLGSSVDAGIYGLATYITGLITMLIISPFSLSFTVSSWQKFKDDNAARFYTKSITYLLFTCLYAGLILSLFTPHFIKIFTSKPDYWAASPFVPWLIISISFYGIHFISVFSFYVTKKTKYILISYLISLLLSIVLNVLLVPLLGINGSVISSIVSFSALPFSLFIFSKHEYFIKYEWAKIAKILIVYVIISYVFVNLDLENKILLFGLKFAASAAFPFILLLVKFYEPIEIQSVKGFINKYIFKKIINE